MITQVVVTIKDIIIQASEVIKFQEMAKDLSIKFNNAILIQPKLLANQILDQRVILLNTIRDRLDLMRYLTIIQMIQHTIHNKIKLLISLNLLIDIQILKVHIFNSLLNNLIIVFSRRQRDFILQLIIK